MFHPRISISFFLRRYLENGSEMYYLFKLTKFEDELVKENHTNPANELFRVCVHGYVDFEEARCYRSPLLPEERTG